ncbi:MAG: hypothetical protein ACPLRH_06135, partial [Desulfotomaculales bacterium]
EKNSQSPTLINEKISAVKFISRALDISYSAAESLYRNDYIVKKIADYCVAEIKTNSNRAPSKKCVNFFEGVCQVTDAPGCNPEGCPWKLTKTF